MMQMYEDKLKTNKNYVPEIILFQKVLIKLESGDSCDLNNTCLY